MASCKEQTEVYARVVGYFRPVKHWNVGKREEFNNRVVYETASFDSEITRSMAVENEFVADKMVSGNFAN
ncbi:MAG TPA: anaerobic ribonucleoside-triphosphate reductase [bacterium]|nr:anaerobic ribonucleoside-triphosphate reductase [bacterium]